MHKSRARGRAMRMINVSSIPSPSVLGEPRGVPGPDTAGEPDTAGRFLFLLALRREVPEFWKSLHSRVWRSLAPGDLNTWINRWHIKDQWFADVVGDTLEYWSASPDSPDARLDPDRKWYLYRAIFEQKERTFRLVLEDPHPRFEPLRLDLSSTQLLPPRWFKHPTAAQQELQEALDVFETGRESIDNFESRVLQACQEQLRAFRKDFNSHTALEHRPDLPTFAHWSVLRFAGLSVAQVIKYYPGAHAGEDPVGRVRRSVNRFAESIQLHLPNWGWAGWDDDLLRPKLSAPERHGGT